MRKPDLGQPKRQGGLSLVPALWDAIDSIARTAGVPRNRVIENVLMEKFLPDGVSQKSIDAVQSSSEKEMERLPR